MSDKIKMEQKKEIAIIDQQTIQDKIYEVRGVKVMLDFELAEIYGYTTTRFNEQVNNNIEKFEGEDFCFYLTQDEFKNLISKKSISSWGGRRKPPRAFTESGLYMLMTVLRGDLATKQSRALIRTFRAMKDYLVETKGLVTQRDILRISIQTAENTESIREMNSMMIDQQKLITEQQQLLLEHDEKLVCAFEQINARVKQSDISPILLTFETHIDNGEYLLREGHPAKADETYMDIYGKADKSVYIVDNYIDIKTLRLLQTVKNGVTVKIFSDNVGNHLHIHDKNDFNAEFPSIDISFIQIGGIMHDRFIVLDYNEESERMYHSGASSKDAAVRLTTAIMEVTSDDMKKQMHTLIDQMLSNPALVLR